MARLTAEEIAAGTASLSGQGGQSSAAFAAQDPRRLDVTAAPVKAIPAAQQPMSQTDSVKRGAMQGVSMGYGDEIAGGVAAAGNAASHLPIIGSLMVLAGSKNSDESISDTYARVRDAERAANQNAHDSNPASYTTANILGSLIPMMLPGTATVKGAAMVGGAMGLGNSDAANVKGAAVDTAMGAAGGAVGGAIAKGAGAVVKGTVDRFAPNMGPAALETLTTPGGAASTAPMGAARAVWDGAVSGAKKELTSPATYERAATAGVATLSPAVAAGAVGAQTAYGIANGAKNGVANTIANRAAHDIANGGTGEIGKKIVDGTVGKVTGTATRAGAANAGTNTSLMDFVKDTFGLNTPAGQANMPDSFKNGMADDAAKVTEGSKDGRPAPDVANIVTEDGNTYLITNSGRRVKLH